MIYIYGALIAAALAIGGYYGHARYEAGEAACEASHKAAQDAAIAETSRRETASAKASTTMLDYLAANLPPIEAKTHEAIERIRKVYVDRPVPAACQWGDGVREELDEVRRRANASPH